MSDEGPIHRRGFFRFGLAKAAQAAADAMSELSSRINTGDSSGPPIPYSPPRQKKSVHRSRPPGALPEREFRQKCTKCNDCIAACPAWAIRKYGDHEPGKGYPLLEPNATACAMCDDPLPCIASCETGALVDTPRIGIRLGLAKLVPGRCVVPMGEECDFCVTHCPIPELAIQMTEAGPEILEAGCTGCGMCAVMCPEDALEIESTAQDV